MCSSVVRTMRVDFSATFSPVLTRRFAQAHHKLLQSPFLRLRFKLVFTLFAIPVAFTSPLFFLRDSSMESLPVKSIDEVIAVVVLKECMARFLSASFPHTFAQAATKALH
jgi:hypothetical protein